MHSRRFPRSPEMVHAFLPCPSTERGRRCKLAVTANSELVYGAHTSLILGSIQLSTFPGRVASVAVDVGQSVLAASDENGLVRVFEVPTGRVKREFKLQMKTHDIALCGDLLAVVGGTSGFPRGLVLSLASGTVVAQLSGHQKPILTCAFGQIAGLGAATLPASVLVTGSEDFAVCVFDGTQNKFSFVRSLRDHQNFVNCVVFAGEHRLATCGSDGKVFIYGPTLDKLREITVNSKSPLYSIAFIPDSDSLLAVGASCVWICLGHEMEPCREPDWQLAKTMVGITAGAASPTLVDVEGRLWALVGSNLTEVDGRLVSQGSVVAMTADPRDSTGNKLVVGFSDGVIAEVDGLLTHRRESSLGEGGSSKIRGIFFSNTSPDYCVVRDTLSQGVESVLPVSAAVHLDAHSVIVLSNKQGVVARLELATSTVSVIFRFPVSTAYIGQVATDGQTGRIFLVPEQTPGFMVKYRFEMLTLAGSVCISVETPHGAEISAIAATACGRSSWVATGDASGLVVLYKVGEAGEVSVLSQHWTYHKNRITGLQFFGSMSLVSVGLDKQICLWGEEGLKGRIRDAHQEGIVSVGGLANGEHVWTASSDRTLKRWSFSDFEK